MGLTDVYAAYLQDRVNPATQAALCTGLEGNGYTLEAAMLRLYWAHGPAWTQVPPNNDPWTGHRIFLGMQPPDNSAAGDLWFDPLETVVMTLLPAEGPLPGERYAPEALARMMPFVGWMAVRPVPNWRYATFLHIAKLQMRVVQLTPPLLFLDPTRILHGNPTDPVTSLTCPEALLYASWFGKGVCEQDEWQAVTRLSSQSLADDLLGSLRCEWAGAYSEGIYAVVTPFNIHKDWDELYEDAGWRQEMFFGEWEAPPRVVFRTNVLYQFGLLKNPWQDPGAMVNVKLMEVLKRTA
jgi:hypothetical protein